jgi:hypothetical protein
MLMEGEAGAEAIALCQPLIDRAGGWTYIPPPDNPPPKEPEDADAATVPVGPPPLDKNPYEPDDHHLIGTPAGIYHRQPVTWEGKRFPDPVKIPTASKGLLRYFAAEALDTEDADLLLPEPDGDLTWMPKIGEHRYGVASLKAFDVFRGLRQASILARLEEAEGRPIVWQIGPDATIARAIKTKLPNATCLISCAPWEMVTSVAFLRAAMPDASILVTDDNDRLADAWTAEDFIFVPSSLVGELAPPRLDLTLDIMALQLQAPEAMEGFARRAYELQSLFVFSLRLDGGSPEWPIADVQPVMDRYYWLHNMPVSPVMMDWIMVWLMDEGFVGRGMVGRPEVIKYWQVELRYTMGWWRLRV